MTWKQQYILDKGTNARSAASTYAVFPKFEAEVLPGSSPRHLVIDWIPLETGKPYMYRKTYIQYYTIAFVAYFLND